MDNIQNGKHAKCKYQNDYFEIFILFYCHCSEFQSVPSNLIVLSKSFNFHLTFTVISSVHEIIQLGIYSQFPGVEERVRNTNFDQRVCRRHRSDAK